LIEQNVVATLHTDVYEQLLLTLWSFNANLCGLLAKFGSVVFPIRKGRFSCDNVDLKIAGYFVGVMSCEKTPRDIDLFAIVDWMKKSAHNIICSPADSETYTPSFALIDHGTVGHVNLPHCTRKILLSGDGQISLELRKVLDVSVVTRRTVNYQLVDAVWSGDHPSIAAPSP